MSKVSVERSLIERSIEAFTSPFDLQTRLRVIEELLTELEKPQGDEYLRGWRDGYMRGAWASEQPKEEGHATQS